MAALKAANAIAEPWACVVFLLLLGELFAQLGGEVVLDFRVVPVLLELIRR